MMWPLACLFANYDENNAETSFLLNIDSLNSSSLSLTEQFFKPSAMPFSQRIDSSLSYFVSLAFASMVDVSKSIDSSAAFNCSFRLFLRICMKSASSASVGVLWITFECDVQWIFDFINQLKNTYNHKNNNKYVVLTVNDGWFDDKNCLIASCISLLIVFCVKSSNFGLLGETLQWKKI